MHKSVFTFGLLASSLVMLAIMPFLNQNNNSFSNTAMAQGYDDYYSESYSKYPTDDKKYECRTGPFEGFFVGSVEFCKFKFDKKDDRKDNIEIIELEHKVLEDLQVLKAYKAHRVLREFKVYKVLLVLMEHKVHLVLKVNQELLNSLMAHKCLSSHKIWIMLLLPC